MHSIRQVWQDTSIADKIFAFSVVLFFSCALMKWDIALKAYYLCSLVAIVSLARRQQSALPLEKREWLLIAVVIAVIAYNGLAWWVNDMPQYGEIHVKSRLGKLIFLIPIYLYIRKNGFAEGLLVFALACGVTFAALHALILFIEHDYIVRLRVGTDPSFKYSLIAASLVLALITLGIRYIKRSKIFAILILLSIIFGLAGILLSLVRGVWLALFLVAASQLYFYWKNLTVKNRLVFVAIFLVAMVSVSQTTYIKKRIVLAYTSTVNYFIDEGAEAAKRTSIGTRLELWRLALKIGAENPVFGIGPAAFRSYIDKNQERHNLDQRLIGYEYPHNDYLAALTAAGIPGLILHVALLFVPAFIFWRYWRKGSHEHQPMAIAGINVVLLYAISCLSYDHLHARFQICIYVMLMSILLGQLKFSSRE